MISLIDKETGAVTNANLEDKPGVQGMTDCIVNVFGCHEVKTRVFVLLEENP